jgi:type I restriction enzyme R subunit
MPPSARREVRARKNAVQSRAFSEKLDLAREMIEAQERGNKLNLSEDEVAFYDALAEKVIADEQLREIARTVRDNATIDW